MQTIESRCYILEKGYVLGCVNICSVDLSHTSYLGWLISMESLKSDIKHSMKDTLKGRNTQNMAKKGNCLT